MSNFNYRPGFASDLTDGITPDMKIIGKIEQRSSYQSGTKQIQNSIKWTITSLLSVHSISHPAQKFASKVFDIYRNDRNDESGAFLWRFYLQRTENEDGFFSVFLRFIPFYNKEIFTRIELSIADRSENKLLTCSFGDNRHFDVKNDTSSIEYIRFHAAGFSEYSDHEESLVILCDMVQSYVPELGVLKDFDKIFNLSRPVSGDVTLVSNDGKAFKAHRLILSARSSFFAGTDMSSRKVKIDCNGEILEQMLQYIYTGKPEKLNLLAKDVLLAADKFNLPGLKAMCEETLLSTLSVDNAVGMLLFADSSCKYGLLKSEVMNFIMMEENAAVMRTGGWLNLKKTNLLKEICQAFADRQKTAKKSTSK
ncbi:uncharacterized protein LOC135833912 [Planococcus citri]|uniref:uncharacterized protein LOC135833912 n=1 Tax=Planococcus citri TaxID=170843 RepID=UPI0031F9CDFB